MCSSYESGDPRLQSPSIPPGRVLRGAYSTKGRAPCATRFGEPPGVLACHACVQGFLALVAEAPWHRARRRCSAWPGCFHLTRPLPFHHRHVLTDTLAHPGPRMSVGPMEIIIVLALALLVFGPKRLPEMGEDPRAAPRASSAGRATRSKACWTSTSTTTSIRRPPAQRQRPSPSRPDAPHVASDATPAARRHGRAERLWARNGPFQRAALPGLAGFLGVARGGAGDRRRSRGTEQRRLRLGASLAAFSRPEREAAAPAVAETRAIQALTGPEPRRCPRRGGRSGALAATEALAAADGGQRHQRRRPSPVPTDRRCRWTTRKSSRSSSTSTNCGDAPSSAPPRLAVGVDRRRDIQRVRLQGLARGRSIRCTACRHGLQLTTFSPAEPFMVSLKVWLVAASCSPRPS